MKWQKVVLHAAICAAPILWATVPAQASIIGSGWLVSGTVAGNAIPGNVPGTTPDFTFTANAVNFSSYGTILNFGNPAADFTVNSFLNSLGAVTSINDITPGIGTKVLSDDAGTYGFIFDITGTLPVTTGESFAITSDDGITFIVNGQTVISSPAPTYDIGFNGTYTGAGGTKSFQLVYGECCGAPAVLETGIGSAPAGIPEPASIALCGLGLLGLGALRLKRRKA
jgi:hypothetical protein